MPLKTLYPSIEVDELPDVMDSPLQLKEKLFGPAIPIVICSLPEIPFVPVHEPDALQLVALVEDQVRVTVLPTSTSEADEDNETVGTGGVELPPPPQDESNINITKCE